MKFSHICESRCCCEVTMEANNSQRIRYRKGTSVILSFFALLLLLPPDVLSQETCAFGEKDGTCLSEDQAGKENQRDKWLKPMTYDFGHGEETFGAYVLPDVSSFYQKSDGTHKKSSPRFSGIAGKFINMGPERMILMWYDTQINSYHGIFLPSINYLGYA